MELLTRLATPYHLTRYEGYQIQESPVSPGQLPDPIYPDPSEMGKLSARALPNLPGVAKYVAEHGIQALRLIDTPEAAKDILGLTQDEAVQLLAALELGKTLYAPPSGSIPLIRSVEDVYRHCFALTNHSQEHLHVLVVNSRYQLLHEQTVAIGSQVGLISNVTDILQVVVQREARSFVLVHNHPSGDPTPSEADRAFTEELKRAAAVLQVQLLDHVIVAKGGYQSILHPQNTG
jgi:DNA repair protein RadC